jgi:uncharacterized membrane protein YbhN (UPF0104 family)
VKGFSGSIAGRLRASAGNRLLRFGVKFGLGAALLLWLAARADWRRTLACLATVSPGWFALAVVTYLAGQSLCAWKWSLLALGLGFRLPLRFYWVNYLGAMFPSLFLPTSVGGDLFRAAGLASRGGDRTSAAVSVLADRGTGILAMAWIAAAAALADPQLLLPRWATLSLDALCAALTLGFLAPFLGRPRFAQRGLLGRALACWDRPSLLLASLGGALGFQLLAVAVYTFLGRALALPVGPAFYFFLCPVVSAATLAPFTVNGLGVREALLCVLFPMVAVGRESAVAFGLAWATLVTLSSVFGGIVLLCATRDASWRSPADRPTRLAGAQV